MKIYTSSKTLTYLTSALLPLVAAAIFYLPLSHENDGGRSTSGVNSFPADTALARQYVAKGDAYLKAKDYLNAKASYQMAVTQNPDDASAREKLNKTMELLRSQKAQNILFDVAVSAADKLFQAGDYDKALQEYENAQKLLPGDPYPKNRINEIVKLKVDIKVKDEEFGKAVAAGDKAYNEKNWQGSMLEYRKAVAVKPNEKYPQDRITELTARIADQKAKDEAYNKAVAAADESFGATRYPDAITSYREALKVKPEQTYPKDRIREAEALLARIANAQAAYDKYVNLADSLYIEKQYFKARENYLLATSAKPSESYPKEMITKADRMLTGQEAAMARALDEQYLKTLGQADKLLSDRQLEPARAEYVKAGNLKPGELYPKQKIGTIDSLLTVALKDKEERYRQAVEAGDKALAGRVLELARTQYQAALDIKPGEKYPKDKLAEVARLAESEARHKAEDARYANSIGRADSLFLEKVYLASKAEFQNALKMKPEEAYPMNRIREIDLLIGEMDKQKKIDAQYLASITKADKLFQDKSWALARNEYSNAATLKPSETYPAARIADIDQALAAAEQEKRNLDAGYRRVIVRADSLLALKSYDASRFEFENALGLKPNEAYPKKKITEIEAALASIRNLEDRYAAAIRNGDAFLASKSYAQAKSAYQEASTLKPGESYPKDKIAEADAALAALAAAKALDDKYSGLIASSDRSLAAKDYANARAGYLQALDLKPAEIYPKEQIASIDKVFADIDARKALDEKYQALIVSADQLLTAKSYEPAKAEYLKASELKPAENYPKTKIAEVDAALAEIARVKALDEEYATLVREGDKLFSDASFEASKAKFQSALKIKPAEEYPKGKIAEIDKKMGELAAIKDRDERYAAALKNGDQLLSQKSYQPARDAYVQATSLKPEEKYPKDKIAEIDAALASIATARALDEKYAGILAAADKLLASKDYPNARTTYQEAADLKPGETYPKEKIAEIGRILADQEAARALDEKYTEAVADGDRKLAAKSFEQARDAFTKASGLKPGEAYPKTKIGEIDAALAEIARLKALDDEFAGLVKEGDKLFRDKEYENSKKKFQAALERKPADQYPKDKIAEIDGKLAELAAIKDRDDRYAAALKNGDQLLSQKSYTPAREAYTEASSLKPGESYPKDKIAEIDAALAALAAAKALDEKYAGMITTADRQLDAKDYTQARASYKQALDLKPGEAYPKDKIALIDRTLADLEAARALEAKYTAAIAEGDKLLTTRSYEPARTAYTTASGLKPDEQYPKTKLGEIDAALAEIARLKALDEEYANTVAGADKLFTEKSYPEAKASYEKALSLKPAESHPKARLAEIDGLLADAARQKAIDDKYAAAIAGADKLMGEKTYDQARTAYMEAGKLKPAENYPKDKITEIDALLEAIARQKSLDDKYKASLAKADQLLADKSLEAARNEYTTASGLKPEEKYPKDKIAGIDAELAALKAQEEAYRTVLASADNLLAQKKYDAARPEYQRALDMKPQASYPRDKIAEIDKALEELLGKQKYYESLISDADRSFGSKDYPKAKEVYQQALTVFPSETYPKERIALATSRIDSIYRANKGAFDKAVADGDRYYNTFEFDKAVDAYTEAVNLLPMEKYPKEMILKIRRTIEENAIVDILKTPLTITSNNEKQFSFAPVNVASRKNNFIYIRIRNLSGKPFNVLMRYGKDKQSNGGVVMRNLSTDGKVTERLVSVRDQDLWSREDNNWISLYPQGGDVEVSFIQVSRAVQ